MIRWFEKNRWFLWVMTFMVFIFIFYVSSLSFAAPPPGPPSLSSTIYHISVFFALSFFLFSSALWRSINLRIFILCIAVSFSYSILDELHQFFVPGRYMSFNDLLYDSLGISLAALSFFFIASRKS
mgnify:CR=1 FL=1